MLLLLLHVIENHIWTNILVIGLPTNIIVTFDKSNRYKGERKAYFNDC